MERGLINLKGLITGDWIFQIPVYQRHYSWDEKQWEDLWNDLLYLEIDKKHYFGTILIKKRDEREKSGLKSFEVYETIDGQQRLTTVLILLKEIISQLKSVGDEDIKAELNEIEKDYLKYKNIYKLNLMGEDSEFFCRYIIDDIEYPDGTLTPSQRRLKQVKLFFREKLEEIKALNQLDVFKDFLIQLKEKIDNLEIIRFPVEKDSDAILIFETVNDRGKSLSNLEKTKSFLMHTAYLSEPEETDLNLKRINERFSRIFRYFQEIINAERGRTLEEDDIQRYHFIIYETEAKGERDLSYGYLDFLKGRIRRIYRKDKQQSLNYVIKYAEDLEAAFFALREIITYSKEDEVGNLLKKIFTLGRVANFYPLLIATWIKFKNEEEKMKEILSSIEIFAFRVYVLGRRRADAGESAICRLAYKVHAGNLGYNEILRKLKDQINYYENDGNLERDLKDESFYYRIAKRDIKYLFFEHEGFLRKRAREPLDIKLRDVLTTKFEIEHIWPYFPREYNTWPSDKKESYDRYKNKLGNLTVASKSWNSQWGNKSFDIKREKYRDSNLRVQRELSDCTKWGEKQIEEREGRIIKFALERWKI